MTLRPEQAKLAAYFNSDNGSGKVRGIWLQSNPAARPITPQTTDVNTSRTSTGLAFASLVVSGRVGRSGRLCGALSSLCVSESLWLSG